MAKTRTRRRYGGDKTRRFRFLERCAAAGISHGAYRWLGDLVTHSNPTLTKPVYGLQTRQGDRIGRCERTVRAYRRECEEAGLIEVMRAEPERRVDGTFGRAFTNVYKFVVGPLRRARKSSSDRAAAGCRSNPSYFVTDVQTLADEKRCLEERIGAGWRPDVHAEANSSESADQEIHNEGESFSASWFANTRKLLKG
jgi:hypothetical protein